MTDPEIPDPGGEPQRLAELLADVLDRLAEACAVERVRTRHTTEENDHDCT